MTISKLYISHSKYKFDSNTKLLDSRNLDSSILNDVASEYHTSINDLGFANFQKAIQAAKEIILCDLNLFDKEIADNDYFTYGRLINELYRVKEKVHKFEWVSNFDYNSFNTTFKTRQNSESVLWTVGCSVTYGAGVHPRERWGTLLAQYINKNEISLSIPGASNKWCADQILRSDIRVGDIVVWGLTDVSRVEYAKNWEWHPATITGYSSLPKKLQYYNLDYFDSQTKFVSDIKHILQVKNFCDKIGVKLILANLLDSTYFNCVFSSLPNYIDFCIKSTYNETLVFLDLGSDNDHPGPKQHQYYAEQIFKLIKENNYGN